MKLFGTLLVTIGAQGPVLLVVSLCAGVLSPGLAQAGYLLLPLSAFLLTLGSFLTAGFAVFEARIRVHLVAIVLVWLGLGIPAVAAGLLWIIPLDPSLRAGVLLSLMAPPIGSAAAIAAMVGLQPRLALVASIFLTLVTPLSIPLLASLLHLGIAIDIAALAARLFSIIGAAALVAVAALRFRQCLGALLPDQRAGTGVAVIGLVIVGLATSQGVRTHWIADPSNFVRMLAAAAAVNLASCAIGTALFSRLDLRAAATVGLVSGNRNVTLAWAATSFGLPSTTEGYVAACVIPVLALPLIIRLLLWLVGFGKRLVVDSHRSERPSPDCRRYFRRAFRR
jgi:ACR3 family arsenite transporter